MTIEQMIRQNANRPIGESIAKIASSLGKHRIFLASYDTPAKTTRPATGPTTQARSFRERVNSVKQAGTTIAFKSGKDAEGRVWTWAYTSEAEFSRAFPEGHHSTELSFRHFLEMIEADPYFGGIDLNPGSDASYGIPREAFETVKEQLRRSADR